MSHAKKQLKITKLFRKGAQRKPPIDLEELREQQEIKQLEQELREKQNELFQIQRNCYKVKASQPKKKKEEFFIAPRKIILYNSVETLKRNIELMAMLTGVEVESYMENDHCCIVFHMQHKSGHVVKHGLRIDMNSDGNQVTKSCLPLGFNIKAITEEFDNIKQPRCLGAIRKALVAYYDRLEQFESLMKFLCMEAELFKSLDGSHIEITFFIQNPAEEEDNQIRVTLILDYRVYDIKPKTYSFKESGEDLPEETSDVLRTQCSVFKKKPLRKAFREAFMNDIGMYRLVRQCGPTQPEQRRPQKRPNRNQNNNDDTFLPEECSDQGEDDGHSE